MAAVGLAVQPASRYARIDPGGVGRDRLQEVEHVEVHGQGGSLVAFLDGDPEPTPQLVPGEGVPVEQLVETRRSADGSTGRVARLGECRVA